MNGSARDDDASDGPVGLPPSLSAARSTALRSSRTLPTHGCAASRASSSADSCCADVLALALAQHVEKILTQNRNVLRADRAAAEQRSHHHRQTIKKRIGAKTAIVTTSRARLRFVAANLTTEAVDGPRRRGADRCHLAALDGAEQPVFGAGVQRPARPPRRERRCRRRRPAWRALALFDGAGERALGVTWNSSDSEQLASTCAPQSTTTKAPSLRADSL